MAELINLLTFTDERGNLTVVEKVIPFDIKRMYYIYGVDKSVRGGHRHKTTYQAAITLQGTCRIQVNDGRSENEFILDSPSKCLLINPEDWHTMDQFSENAILMVLASTTFDPADYIFDSYLK